MDTTLNLNIVKTETAPCTLALKVEVLPLRVKKSFDEVIALYSKQVKVPGFRAGKVPTNVIIKRFKADVENETKKRLLDKAYSDTLNAEKLSILGEPEIQDVDELAYGQENSFTFSFAVEVAPVFDVPEYKGLKLSKNTFVLDQAHVDTILHDLQERNIKYTVTDQAAKEGDMLKADYVAVIPEGFEYTDKSKFILNGTNSWLVLKQPEMLPGTSTSLIGASAGDERSVQVTFPETHYNEEIAGKTFDYTVKIHEVHSATTPEIDDELAKTVGADSLDDLRKRIEDNMKAQADQQANELMSQQIMDTLLAAVDFPLPPKLLESEKNRLAGSDYQQALRSGSTKEELEPKKEEMLAEAEKKAANMMRSELLIQAISKAEGIQVEQPELIEAVQQFAQMQRVTIDELIKKNEGIVSQIMHSLIWKKTIDAIIGHAEITEVTPEPEATEAN